MAVFFEQSQQGRSSIQPHEIQWNRGPYFEMDFPYKMEIKKLPCGNRMTGTRRWCERHLKYDVFFEEKHNSLNGYITDYYWIVHFECNEDAVYFKLMFDTMDGWLDK